MIMLGGRRDELEEEEKEADKEEGEVMLVQEEQRMWCRCGVLSADLDGETRGYGMK